MYNLKTLKIEEFVHMLSVPVKDVQPGYFNTVHLLLYSGYPVAIVQEGNHPNEHRLMVQKGNKSNHVAKVLGPFVNQRFGLDWKDAEICSTESMFFSSRSFFEPLQEHLG